LTLHSSRFPRFYVTPAGPCPYLPGRVERKVFTELKGDDAQALNDALTLIGFRRSQNVAYRPACEDCQCCVSVRVRVNEFEPTRSMRRILAKNRDIEMSEVAAWASEEQFMLLKRYLRHRHPDGGMTHMDAIDFASMIESSPIDSRIIEYRLQPDDPTGLSSGKLLAGCLTDILSDGLSLVYSFFEPTERSRGLGNFVVLSHIDYARRLGLPYVYLGYWIADCRKMAYKTIYQPLDQLTQDGWKKMTL
jgi:arginyl-tRNA--protein-N-Asp/Glu arginylyltransferase